MCIAMKNRVGPNTGFRSRRVRASLALATAVVGLSPFWLQRAQAANFTWDAGNTANGATIDPASGTWNTTAGNTVWNSGGTNVVWSNNNNLAQFAGADGTYAVTLGTTGLTATNVDFENSGNTLTGTAANFLTLNFTAGTGSAATYTAANSEIFVAAGKTFNIGTGADATIVKANGSNLGFSAQIFVGSGSTLNINAGASLLRDNNPGTNNNGGIRFVSNGTAATPGVVNVFGTVSNTTNNDGIRIAQYSTDFVTMNIKSGGVLTSASTGVNTNNSAIVVEGGTGTGAGAGILNVESGGNVSVTNTASAFALTQNAAGTAAGTVNLSGTLTVPRVIKGNGNGTFNFNGGTLKANVTNNTNFMTGLTQVNVRDGGAKVDTNGFDVTIGQSLAHSTIAGDAATDGGLTKNSNGNLTLTANNGYTGPTTINAGTVSFTGSGALSATSSVTLNGSSGLIHSSTGAINTSGALNVNGNSSVVVSGSAAISAGSISVNGNSLLTVSGSGVSAVGSIAVNGNSLLTVNGSAAISAGGGITVNGSGAKYVNNSTTSSSAAVNLTLGRLEGSGTVGDVIVANSSANTIADTAGANIKLTANSLIFQGSGALNLSLDGGATTTEALTVNNAFNTSGTAGAIKINLSSLAALNPGTTYDLVGFNSSNAQLSDFSSGTGFNPRSYALNLTSNKLQLNVTAADSPKWTGAASNEWSTNNIPNPKNWTLVNAGTPTDYIQGDDVLFDDTAATTTPSISVANVSPTSATFSNVNKTYTVSGPFGIANGLINKNGSGTVTFTNANTTTGITTINAGVIQLGDGVTDGSLNGDIVNNASLIYNTVGASTSPGNISGSGAVTKIGPGTISFTGSTSTFTGGLTVNAGAVGVTSNTQLGGNNGTDGAVTLNGATLRTTNIGVLTNTHPVTIGASGGTIDVEGVGSGGTGQIYFHTANTLLGSGPLTVIGTGALNSTGAGNLRVDQTNTYDGQMTLRSGGIFEYGVNGAVSTNATFVIGNEGEVAVEGNPATAVPNSVTFTGGTNSVLSFETGNSGSFTGPIALNANAIIAMRDWYSPGTARNGTISGQISGNGALTVNSGTGSGGILTLSNSANNYTGGTTINAARVLATTNTSLSNGSVTVSGSNGEVQLGDGVNISNVLTINSGAGSTAQGIVWVPTGTATYSGDITVNAAATAGGHFANNTNGMLIVSGKITAVPDVPVSVRNGTVIFSNTSSSYSGLILNQGTLRLGATNAIPAAATIDIGASGAATLDLAGFSQTLVTLSKNANAASVANSLTSTTSTLTITGSNTFSGTIVDGGGVTAVTISGGSVTLAGANTYSGVTTLSGGTLELGVNAQAPVLSNVGGADIRSGQMILDYSGTSPAANLRSAISAGRVRDSVAPTGVGVAYFDDGSAKVTVRPDLFGDANGDNAVNMLDFNALATNFGSGQVWQQGDFTYDGVVDSLDFNSLAQNFNRVTPPLESSLTPALGTLVPEPASLGLLAMLGVSVSRRRRSK